MRKQNSKKVQSTKYKVQGIIATVFFTLYIILCTSYISFAQNTRQWGTYYGGTRTDNGYSIAYDASGNIYLAGYTSDSTSAIFTSGGFQNAYGGGANDAMLIKFDSSGNRLWATYYGGTGDDQGYAVTTDASDNVYITGYTSGANGIATAGGFQNTSGGGNDAFVAKFDASGNLLWGTYYGGNRSSYGQALAVDNADNLYLGGYTNDTLTGSISSGGFQNLNGGGTYDAFLVKFDASGSRLWGTYYGGSGTEAPNPPVVGANIGLAIDAADAVYMTGNTTSNNAISSSNGVYQPVYGGGTDAYLVKFDASGTRIWGTYFGGGSGDQGHSVAVYQNILFLSGRTASNSGIATAGAYQTTYGGGTYDSFLARFDTSGAITWGTYYGGGTQEWGLSVTTDAMGNIYQAGRSSSNANVASSDGFQTTFGGNVDAYVVKFDTSGTRYCATYLGGTGGDFAYGVTVSAGKIYMAGYTASNSGIASSNGYDDIYGGGGNNDAFLAKFSSCLDVALTPTDALCNGSCDGMAAANPSGATMLPYSYQWSNGQTTQTATGLCAGTYYVTVNDANGNSQIDSVVVNEPVAISINTNSTPATCGNADGDATANPSNGVAPYSYLWNPSGQTTTTATGIAAGIYSVTVTDANGCTQTAQVIVNNNSTLGATITSQADVSCNGGNDGSATVTATLGTSPYTYSWSPSGGTSSTATNLSAGNYNCTVTDAGGCIVIQSVTINEPVVLAATASNGITICMGDSTMLNVNATGGTGAYTYVWTPVGSLNDNTLSNPMATPGVTTTYTVLVVDANGCSSSDNVTITVMPVPVAAISGSSTACLGDSSTLIASGGIFYMWNTGVTTASISISPISNTTYTVIVSNGGNCSDTAIISITVTTPPTVFMLAPTNATCSSCADGSAGAFATGNPPLTYLWSNGTTNQIANGLLPGTYTVCVTDVNGCAKCDTVTVGFTVGIINTGSPNFAVYPNPFSDITTIFFGNIIPHAEVKVMDMLGKEVRQVVVNNSDKAIISKNNLRNGIYFMKIVSEGNTIGTGKLIVE
ncbi:MAG: T9SS type A sorting domain-containing protein [Bacteroidetes bacterium]|nr:T9SS type A sorting domain-containing protein [Bacteroidota bacterium]